MLRAVIAAALWLMAFCAVAQSVRTVTVLGVVFRYTDTTQPANGPAILNGILFGAGGYRTGGATLRTFYAEGSRGTYNIVGFTVPTVAVISVSQPPGKCVTPSGTSISAGLNAAFPDRPKYERMVFVIPASKDGCPGGHASTWRLRDINGTLHSRPVAISWSFTDRFIIHEYGHLDGLGHAKSLNCGAVSLGPTCSQLEYGNIWDTMGNGAVQTYGAPLRTFLGWTQPIDHQEGTATYTIGAAPGATKLPTAIRLPIVQPAHAGVNVSPHWPLTLWIEYRAPYKFDARMTNMPTFAEGAMVHVSGSWTVGGRSVHCPQASPCLLDMSPGDNSFSNGGLPVGAQWTDSFTGAMIRIESRTADTLTVSVGIGALPPPRQE